MAHRGLDRGAAIRVGREENLPNSAQVLHYESGPVTYRQFVRAGEPWLAVYEAAHDGVGWLVFRSTCRPIFFLDGDHVHCRFRFLEDRGSTVVVEQRRGGMTRAVEIDRDQVVFIEEAIASTNA